MNARQLWSRLTLAALLLVPSGCIELTGQRIAWYYDPESDTLKLLLFYDGIHDTNKMSEGAEQIRQFVAHGDIMLVDWFGHLKMDEFRQRLADPTASEADRRWAQLWLSVTTKPVGYYTEPDGRLGAAQWVVIPNASKFLRELSAVISLRIQASQREGPHPADDTLERIKAAAEAGHPWVELAGHAFRVTIPVEPADWSMHRAVFVREMAQRIACVDQPESDPEKARQGKMLLTLLACTPLSYTDHGDTVTFVLGHEKRTSTLRLALRDEYAPGMEPVVSQAVLRELDQALGRLLLAEPAERPEPLQAVLDWGPAEEPVRALMTLATRAAEPELRVAAIQRLERFAVEWNQAMRRPAAPPPVDSRDAYLTAWRIWYRQMKEGPASW